MADGFNDPMQVARTALAMKRVCDLDRWKDSTGKYHQAVHDHLTALTAERDALRAEVERLREAVRGCLRVLDATISESGRGIEWGEEDAFRMGEWFEDEDIAAVEAARAALGDSKP